MEKYRKKPVVIEAVQWTGKNITEVLDFMDWRNAAHDAASGLTIRTLEGNHHASPGDFIIKGVNGEFYPCKPDIFEKTYEKISSASAEKKPYGYFIDDLVGMTDDTINTELRTALEKIAPGYDDEKIIIDRKQGFACIKGFK